LDGVCLTEHNRLWPKEEVEALRERHGFLVLRGVEVTCTAGDVLVFGLEEPVEGMVTPQELRELVDQQEGVMIAAHPFRGFLVLDFSRQQLTLETAVRRPLFGLVEALEVGNAKVTESENDMAAQVAEHLAKARVAGSDAHHLDDVGTFATRFLDPVAGEADLIRAIKTGRCRPIEAPFSQATGNL
jgi:predicted metal-dependent phosphoesterase TrpH